MRRAQRPASASSWVTSNKVGAALGPLLEQAVDDEIASHGIEISGRLVSQQQFGAGNKGAGDRHTLLFTAGQLRRIMLQPLAETDRAKGLRGGCESIAEPAQLERQGHVFERGHRRDQMKRLEHDADAVAPQPRQRILIEGREILPVEHARARRSAARSRPAPSAGSTLPEPDGPTTATVSPAAISNEIPRRMLTGPAALPRVRWTSSTTTSGPPE